MQSQTLQQYLSDFKPDELANTQSYITIPKAWPRTVSAVAMDMGGTNFRIARVSFDENSHPIISDYKQMTMPGVNTEITAKEFYEFFEDMKSDYKATNVGLCFSYPAEILKDRRARIIEFSKGVRIRGAENTILNAKVINDTATVQLGTVGANMGMVLGTGFNICYTKGDSIINSEAGRCKDFSRQVFDFGDLSEMQLSGAYLRPLIKKCSELGLATKNEIYERAAKIAAAELFGIARYAGIYKLKIAAEGSVFYNVAELQSKIKENLDILGCNYEFLDGRGSTLIGAAIAAFI